MNRIESRASRLHTRIRHSFRFVSARVGSTRGGATVVRFRLTIRWVDLRGVVSPRGRFALTDRAGNVLATGTNGIRGILAHVERIRGRAAAEFDAMFVA